MANFFLMRACECVDAEGGSTRRRAYACVSAADPAITLVISELSNLQMTMRNNFSGDMCWQGLRLADC